MQVPASAEPEAELWWPRYRGPDDLAAIEAVPLADRGLPPTTYALLTRAATRWPNRTALSLLPTAKSWDKPVTLTFAELRERVHRIANTLIDLGIGRGGAVGILSPNTSGTLCGILAAQTAGIAAPVNPALSAERVRALLDATGARVLLAAGPELDPRTWATVAELAPGSALHTVLVLRPDAVTDPAPDLPQLPGIRVSYLDDLADTAPADRLVVTPPEATDHASYFHTGGTTGIPKIAVHTHANEVAMAWTLAANENIEQGAMFAALPLFHVNALLVTGLAPLLAGREVVWAPPLGYRDPDLYPVFWKIVEHYRIAGMSAVPTVYAVLSYVDIDADISSLRMPIVGAAPLSDTVRQGFAAHTGVELLEGYGMTEATCASAVSYPGHVRPGTVGQRLPYQHIKAVQPDPDTGGWTDLPAGAPGLLVISGPTVFAGYLRDGRPSRDGVVRGGWLDTGDHGSVDADGFVSLTGRVKDLIIRGGHNIDPAGIEEALLRHPAVAAAAAVGRPDRHAGEVPVAYAVLHPGATATAQELREWAIDHVPEPAAAPKDVHLIDQLPLTEVGKVFKPALRDDAARRLITGELVTHGSAARLAGPQEGNRSIGIMAADAADRDRIRTALAGYPLAWHFAELDDTA